MQEDIEHRAVTLAMNVSKLTGRTFRNALAKLLHFLKNKHQQHKQQGQKFFLHCYLIPPKLHVFRSLEALFIIKKPTGSIQMICFRMVSSLDFGSSDSPASQP